MNVFMIVAGVLLLLNIYVNIRLVFSPDFNRVQKFSQSIIIWLLPFIGGFIVFYFVRDQSRVIAPNRNDIGSSGYASGIGDGGGGD